MPDDGFGLKFNLTIFLDHVVITRGYLHGVIKGLTRWKILEAGQF